MNSSDGTETTDKATVETVAVETVTPDEGSKKRSVETVVGDGAPNSDDQAVKKACTSASARPIVDKAVEMGLKPGDRIEVQWEIGTDGDNDEDNEQEPTFRWWPATLLAHDEQSIAVDEESNNAVAIRTLDYDPYPEGGFPERSQETVVFLGQGTLIDLKSEETMVFRKEGEHYDEDDQPVILMQENDMEDYLNNMMASLIEKHSDKFRQIPAAQQAMIAERLATGKEKFIDALKQSGKGTIVTAEKVQELLASTVQSEE